MEPDDPGKSRSVTIASLAIAPVMPGLISGTIGRVGSRHAANTIGIQIAATGIGVAIVPGLAGILARRFSHETIPVYLIVLIIILIASHLFSPRERTSCAPSTEVPT